jgi:hypothetical protein
MDVELLVRVGGSIPSLGIRSFRSFGLTCLKTGEVKELLKLLDCYFGLQLC